MPSGDDFVTAHQAAELAVLRMSLIAVLARASVDDSNVQGLRVEVDHDGFGQPFVNVELVGHGGHPVGGYTL